MRIAVIGGGVIGLAHASRLAFAGHDVVILARGARTRALADAGVTLAEPGAAPVLFCPSVVETLPDKLDWVLVAVRSSQLDAAVTPLLDVPGRFSILTLSNAPRGLAALRARNPDRIVAGFPGIGGFFDDADVLHYLRIPDQPMTVEARPGPQVAALVNALRGSGFRVVTEPRMDAWLKTHAVFICGLGGAVVRAGSCAALAADDRGVAEMIAAVRQGFRALSGLGCPVRPFKLPLIFRWMPRSVSGPFWARKLTTPAFTIGLAPHVLNAKAEMSDMAQGLRGILAPARLPMPDLEGLLTLLEQRAEGVRSGSG